MGTYRILTSGAKYAFISRRSFARGKMKGNDKTKGQLVEELENLCRHAAELAKLKEECRWTDTDYEN